MSLFTTYTCYDSKVFQLPEGRMLTYFGIVSEGSLLDVPNAALGRYLILFVDIDPLNTRSSRISFKPMILCWMRYSFLNKSRIRILLLLVVSVKLITEFGHHFCFYHGDG